MKLIEAMKKVKDLLRKADDIRGKVAANSATLDFETPMYGERQQEQIAGWIQSHSDILKEILRLRIAIQRTNLETQVAVTFGTSYISKSLAEWVHRRRDLANLERDAWAKLTDRGLKEGRFNESTGQVREVKIKRYFSPEVRDEQVEYFRSEPSTIDATLEVVNAVTDLKE